jgi:diguanylate cyclase (GGDEF)-like protein
MSGAAPTFREFLVANREDILERSRATLAGRELATSAVSEPTNGLSIFLDQLITILPARENDSERTAERRSVGPSAMLHGGELLRRGLTVGQVVQDYGSVCQSVTEIAAERNVAIAASDFQTFNHCLDEAIAQAVTEYEHQRDHRNDSQGIAHLGFLAHEMRNLLTTSMLTFDAIERGTVGVRGNTGALLGRNLRRMRSLIDRTLTEVRLDAEIQTLERVVVAELVEEIEMVAMVDAKEREIQLSVVSGARDVSVTADSQILSSVVANLVQNAIKFTRRNGRVTIRARATGDRALIEVQDECGGLPPGNPEDLFLPFERRGANRTGLGLGLSISLKGVRASGGELHVRDLPGVGCVFTIDLPKLGLATDNDHDPPSKIASARATPLPPAASGDVATVLPRPSVLVADDDEDILMALEHLLSSRYQITLVRDGNQALRALETMTFDLAIVDLHLPAIDGLTVLRTVRAGGSHRAPAFLFLSGESNPQVKAQALALGAVDYMTKPFDPDELLARTARTLATVARETSLLADAMTDSLTGLANYRSFTQSLDDELERSRRYQLPLSLITLDLDHMKDINDRHGHDAGDDAIRLVAKVLAGAVRRFEVVARQGGDEFAIILPNTRATDARQLADRLHEALGQLAVCGQKLSASIGLACWDNGRGRDTQVEVAALIKASDDALYRAKRAGRDRVELQTM